jgi:hypothetical protein
VANPVIDKFLAEMQAGQFRIEQVGNTLVCDEDVVFSVEPNLEAENATSYRLQIPIDGGTLHPIMTLFLDVLFGRQNALVRDIPIRKLILDHHPFYLASDQIVLRAETEGESYVLVTTPRINLHQP